MVEAGAAEEAAYHRLMAWMELEARHHCVRQATELLLELLLLRLTSSKAALTTLTRLSLAGHREVEGLRMSPRPVTLTAPTLPSLTEEDREEADRLLPSMERELGEEERLWKSRSTIRCRFPCTLMNRRTCGSSSSSSSTFDSGAGIGGGGGGGGIA